MCNVWPDQEDIWQVESLTEKFEVECTVNQRHLWLSNEMYIYTYAHA